MSSGYFPPFSTIRNEIVNVTLDLGNYVMQKELTNLTGSIDTSDFALKTNVAEITSRVDDIDVDKINNIDLFPGQNYVEGSYLYFKQRYEYFKIDKVNPHKLLSWKSAGVSDETFEPLENKNTSKIFLTKYDHTYQIL